MIESCNHLEVVEKWKLFSEKNIFAKNTSREFTHIAKIAKNTSREFNQEYSKSKGCFFENYLW